MMSNSVEVDLVIFIQIETSYCLGLIRRERRNSLVCSHTLLFVYAH